MTAFKIVVPLLKLKAKSNTHKGEGKREDQGQRKDEGPREGQLQGQTAAEPQIPVINIDGEVFEMTGDTINVRYLVHAHSEIYLCDK